jgi:hypothetical protein
MAYRQIETFHCQRANTVGKIKLESNLGVRQQEPRNPWHDLLPREGNRRGDAQQARWHANKVAHACEAVRDPLERIAQIVDKTLAGLGKPDAARRALNKRHSCGTLEFGDALAHRGFANAQALRRCGVTTLLAKDRQRMKVSPELFGLLGFHAAIVHQNEQSIQLYRLGRTQGAK